MKLFSIVSATFFLLGSASAGMKLADELDHNRADLLQVVQEILSKPGVDPTDDYNYAIRLAAANGHLEVVQELLSHPYVDPTANNNEAIRKAAAYGHLEVVKLLLSHPAVDPTANGNEAFRMASENGHLEVAQELLSRPGVGKRVVTFNDLIAVRHYELEPQEVGWKRRRLAR